MTRGIDQFELVIAAEVLTGRVERASNRDNFVGVERLTRIHEEADEPDE
jgi:hypothetical protein